MLNSQLGKHLLQALAEGVLGIVWTTRGTWTWHGAVHIKRA